MKRAYVEIPEGQMHYRYGGAGREYIVLLHMSGSSSDEYERAGDLLAERGYHVLAPDLLGFGGSDCPPRFYSMREHMQTVLAFLDAVEVDSAYFYGNMATANLIAHLGAEFPGRIRGLLLGHPLYNPDPGYFLGRRHLPEFARVEVREDGGHLTELWRRATKYGDPADISDQRCRCLHLAGEWGETLHWALHEDTPLGAFLPRIKVKTVIAAYDFFGDPALLKSAVGLLPNGCFDCYENATPYVARSAPERVADMICKHFPVEKR